MSTRFEKLPLISLSFGWFMVIVDATITNVALPELGQEFGASVGGLQWVADAYTVTFAALLLSAGSLGDRIGGRKVFQSGLVVFIAASTACALAPGLGFLIIARVVQGLGAALLVPSSLTLVQAAYADRGVRARAIGVWAMVGGVASGCGPLLGGILAGTLGWRWLFGINIPVGLIGLAMVAKFVKAGPSPRTDRRGGFDLWGQLAAIVALVGLTAAMVQAGREGVSTATVGLLVAFAAGTAGFVLAERRIAAPMLPPALFRSRAFSAATSVGLLMNLAFYGQLFVLTLYFQQARHFPPLVTGLALLPQTGVIAFGSWAGGRLTSRVGPRVPMLIGLSVGATGFAVLTMTTPTIAYGAIVVPLAAAGFGISFTMPAATSAVVEGVPEDRGGIASGSLNAARQVGGAIGIALLGAFIAGGGFVPGFRMAMIVAAVTYVVAVIIATRVPASVDDADRERIAQLIES